MGSLLTGIAALSTLCYHEDEWAASDGAPVTEETATGSNPVAVFCFTLQAVLSISKIGLVRVLVGLGGLGIAAWQKGPSLLPRVRLASCSALGGRGELERCRIGAIAQTGWSRPVRKNVADVPAALRTVDLGSVHAEAPVLVLAQRLFADRLPKAWPAGAGVILVF